MRHPARLGVAHESKTIPHVTHVVENLPPGIGRREPHRTQLVVNLHGLFAELRSDGRVARQQVVAHASIRQLGCTLNVLFFRLTHPELNPLVARLGFGLPRGFRLFLRCGDWCWCLLFHAAIRS